MQKHSSPDTTHLHPGEHFEQQEVFGFAGATRIDGPIGEGVGGGVLVSVRLNPPGVFVGVGGGGLGDGEGEGGGELVGGGLVGGGLLPGGGGGGLLPGGGGGAGGSGAAASHASQSVIFLLGQ